MKTATGTRVAGLGGSGLEPAAPGGANEVPGPTAAAPGSSGGVPGPGAIGAAPEPPAEVPRPTAEVPKPDPVVVGSVGTKMDSDSGGLDKRLA